MAYVSTRQQDSSAADNEGQSSGRGQDWVAENNKSGQQMQARWAMDDSERSGEERWLLISF